MRITGISRLPTKLERNPISLARGREPRENRRDPLLAELGGVVLALVDAGIPRRGRVQVEGVPGEREGVGWVLGFVRCDGAGEPAVADVAPLYGVRGLVLGAVI